METIYIVLLALLFLFFVGPAIFPNRSPIPELSEYVYKIKEAGELDALLSSTSHVVVDFYADWCPPCRAIAPIFSKLADAHSKSGHIAFAKVNVDHVQNVARRYSVAAMPTFVFFENGTAKGVAVEGEGIKGRQSVTVTDDGRVSKVCGADRQALEAVVRALAGKEENDSGGGETGLKEE